MNKVGKHILDIGLYLVVFFMLQLVVTYAVNISSLLYNGMDLGTAVQYLQAHSLLSTMTVIIISAVSAVLTIVLFMWLRWTPMSASYIRSKPWITLFWVVLLALGAILPSTWMLEQMEIEVPSAVERMLTALMGNRWGYVAVGILVPIAEEVVFRGAILRTLLQLFARRSAWIAIVVSALLFGLAHGNMAQFPHAFLMGLLLGWMFVRTGSIVPGIVLHWVNNSTIFILYNVIPNSANAKVIDIFGGSQRAVWMALLFSLCIFLPALFQLSKRLKKADETVL